MSVPDRIECARVFINFGQHKGDENYNFTLKCFLCHCHFKHWTSFVLHVQARHKAHLQQAQTGQTTADEDQDEAAVDALKEEIMEFETSQQRETIEIIDATDVVDQKWAFDEKEFPPIIDFQVEIMPLNYRSDDIKSESGDDSSANEYEEAAANPDQDSEYTPNEEQHCQSDASNDSDNNEGKSENTRPPAANTRKRSRTAPAAQTSLEVKAAEAEEKEPIELNDKSGIETNSTDSENDEENSLKSKKKRKRHPRTKGPFFHMRKTSPKVMLTFIEIMRQHPCHWDPAHSDYNCRDARYESAERITELVAQRLKIKITPEVARSSVLFLCRWYDREYMRTTAGARSRKPEVKRPRPNTHYTDYYAALHAFLPSKHLKVVACDQCEREFKRESHLLTHKHAVHNAPAPFKCGYCPRSFAHLSTLRLHENRHTKERTWPCELCSHRAVSMADYQTHMTAHTTMRAFVCETCGAAYKSSTSLSVHRRTHEPPRLSCPRCGKMFRENYRLKRHMWEHENDIFDDDDNPDDDITRQATLSHKCDSCKRRFASVATLQQHRNFVHGINSSGSASAADAQTVTQIEVVRTKTSHGQRSKRARSPSPTADEQETDYSCTACEVDFINLKELRAHSLKMHDIVII